jgi:hypothetical protein
MLFPPTITVADITALDCAQATAAEEAAEKARKKQYNATYRAKRKAQRALLKSISSESDNNEALFAKLQENHDAFDAPKRSGRPRILDTLTEEELAAKHIERRAKAAEYSRMRRKSLTAEQRAKENKSRADYAKQRYAKMRAAYLSVVAKGIIEP